MDMKIIDVAKRAGVSPATVSRVFNESNLVKERTKQKVMKAIEELGYFPNAAAKQLRSQKTMTIGVVVTDINISYNAEIIKGIENIAYSRKYKVLICDTNNQKDKEQDYLSLLMNRTVDGMIFVAPHLKNQVLIDLAEKKYVIGLIGRYIEHSHIPCAYTDNVKFSKEVVEHLLERGHKEIAFMSGYADVVDSYERLEGYIKALRDREISFRPELIENGNFNEEGGYEAIKRLFSRKQPFSAIYAANDEMALGIYKACQELGMQMPEQLAIVGVDNDRICKYIRPSLSTVNQPKYTMGALIAEKLIDQMNDDEFSNQRIFNVDSKLIIRQSSDFYI
ncbi:MAG: ccpA 4 [Bacilli bacterium]|nr:ccpA 4 [Bacilli bacterium]